MAKFHITKADQEVILTVFIQDSSSTTGAGLGSLDENSGIVGGYVKKNGTGVALVVDEDVATEGTYQAPSAAGKVRIGTPVNMRTGVYELHFHNDLFTTADWVTISLGGASDMADLLLEIQLDTDPAAARQTAADAAIVANHLDHLFKNTYDPSSKPGAGDALLNELVENDSGVPRYTANTLEQGPGGGGVDVTTDSTSRDASKASVSALTNVNLASAYDPAKTAAQAGDEMALLDGAITAAKHDQSTAFPVGSADTGSSKIARTGADSDTLETLSGEIGDVIDRGNIAWITGGVGSGLTAVNEDTGGSNNLAYLTDEAVGIEGASVKAYVASEYVASGTDATVRGFTTTTDAGGFVADLMLNSGETYTIWYFKRNEFGPDTKDITV